MYLKSISKGKYQQAAYKYQTVETQSSPSLPIPVAFMCSVVFLIPCYNEKYMKHRLCSKYGIYISTLLSRARA